MLLTSHHLDWLFNLGVIAFAAALALAIAVIFLLSRDDKDG